MMEVELTNVTEALANLTERGAVDPVVKATLMLSESGFVSVTDAVAFGEIQDDSLSGLVNCFGPYLLLIVFCIPGKLKGLFGGSSSPAEDLAQDAEHVSPREEAEAATSGTPELGKDKKKTKDANASSSENTIPLGINVAFTTIAPMTVEEKRAARNRYTNLNCKSFYVPLNPLGLDFVRLILRKPPKHVARKQEMALKAIFTDYVIC